MVKKIPFAMLLLQDGIVYCVAGHKNLVAFSHIKIQKVWNDALSVAEKWKKTQGTKFITHKKMLIILNVKIIGKID